MPQVAKHKQIVKHKRVVKRKAFKSNVKRTSYSIKQKEEVVNYAKEYGRNSVAAHFEINKSMVGRWVKVSINWTDEINRNIKKVSTGRRVFYPEVEKKLYDWIIEQRKQGFAVTYSIIRVKMLEILRDPDIIVLYGNLMNDFKMSNRWLYAFMKRQKLSLRHHTKISQKLPQQTEQLLESFYRFVTRLRIEKSYKMCNIFNMDETPVYFDMAGNEKNRFTVVLTCAADGTKLPPICIFKGKRLGRGEQIPSGVVVWFQENSWMDSKLMINYIDYFNNNRSRDPTMLVYNSFRSHLEESVKAKFHDNNIDLAVIPGGLTSICQPLDVAINKPFKDNLRKEWHLWMANDGAGETTAGNLRRAKYSAWKNISNETIINSFVSCGITDSLNSDHEELEISDIDDTS
ncbi:pogo transposable element with KRAB domain [Rhizophagus irregularis DAOM 181602=DAOM 197198]|nr:pogo transposable element with KRAB domain [Rhizophagus irregularis DAOM 181602=DAOM 197198]